MDCKIRESQILDGRNDHIIVFFHSFQFRMFEKLTNFGVMLVDVS